MSYSPKPLSLSIDAPITRSIISDPRYGSFPPLLQAPISIDTVDVTYVDKFLGDAEISRLMDGIRQSTTAKRVVLRGNCIGPTGAYVIASVLKDHEFVNLFSLEWNQILSEGAVKIADVLASNKSLTSLDLRNNSIGDDGAFALAKALITNTTLRNLDLRWNQISDKGALAFRDAILNRRPAIKLSINGNLINDNAMTTIEVWSSTGFDINDSESMPCIDTIQSSSEMTLKAQNEVLQKELHEMRLKFSSHQSNTLDVKRQLDVSAVRVTELEQQCVREEFTIKGMDEALKQAKESIAILVDERRNMMNTWDLERSRILDEMKMLVLAKDAEILHLKGERDIASDLKLKLEGQIDRLTSQLQDMDNSLVRLRQNSQAELRDSLNKYNDMNIMESKLKAEVSTLKHNLERLNERNIVLERQSKSLQANQDLKQSGDMQKHQDEIAKIRRDYDDHIQQLQEKHARQAIEISTLQAKIAESDLISSKQTAKLQLSHEESLGSMRVAERKRYQVQESDLKQQLDSMTTLFRESEALCNSLSNELETSANHHIQQYKLLESRSSALEVELRSRQHEFQSAKDEVIKTKGEHQRKLLENDDLHQRLMNITNDIHQYKKENQELHILHESQSLKIQSYESRLKELQSNKIQEFEIMSSHIQQALRTELLGLRGKFDIPSNSSNAVATSVTRSTDSININMDTSTRSSKSGSPHKHRSSSSAKNDESEIK